MLYFKDQIRYSQSNSLRKQSIEEIVTNTDVIVWVSKMWLANQLSNSQNLIRREKTAQIWRGGMFMQS